MTCIIDVAQDFIVDQNLVALAKSEKLAEKALEQSEKICLDCGDEIPVQRQQLGGIKYCTFCQAYHKDEV